MKAEEPIVAFESLNQDKVYTYLDYVKWQFAERVELIKGKIFKMSPAPATKHQKILRNFFVSIVNQSKQGCQVFCAPFDVRLPVKNATKYTTVVQPDICMICDETKLDERGCNGAPDLIIEIVSETNRKHDTDVKFNIYEQSGVKEYWLVFPETQTVLRYVLTNEKYIGLQPLVAEQTLTSETFKQIVINLGEVFE